MTDSCLTEAVNVDMDMDESEWGRRVEGKARTSCVPIYAGRDRDGTTR